MKNNPSTLEKIAVIERYAEEIALENPSYSIAFQIVYNARVLGELLGNKRPESIAKINHKKGKR